jgi:homoserine dehydrogenase
MATGKFGVGVIGCGTVGGGVVKLLVDEADNLRRKTGVAVELRKAVDIDPAKRKATGLPAELLAEDARAVLDDPEIRVVVEVIGGVKAACSLVEAALAAGKHVVTANKELLAKKGPELLALARKHNVTLHFEASACGGIPVIHALGQSLAVNRFERLYGIVNGTTNFILTKMHREGAEFATVLREAQELGYAEADPTADVDGHDATYKLAILAALAFNTAVDYREIFTEGIRGITARDIELAKEYGYVIKLLAIGIEHDEKSVELRVHPMMIRRDHPLAAVSDSFNAVFARGNYVGDVMFYGRGAGAAAHRIGHPGRHHRPGHAPSPGRGERAHELRGAQEARGPHGRGGEQVLPAARGKGPARRAGDHRPDIRRVPSQHRGRQAEGSHRQGGRAGHPDPRSPRVSHAESGGGHPQAGRGARRALVVAGG